MARMALWAQEEIDEDLQDVDLSLAIGNYGQGGVYDENAQLQQQQQIDEGTLIAMQQHMAQQAAFAQVPDVVKRFIIHFHQAVLDNNLAEITVAYESGWNRLTEKYYAKTEWPEAEVIAPLVQDDQIFLILYRELYYRHVYSRLQPNIDDRFHSYENSCELFNYLLNSDGPVPLDLPEQWLWDIIDEFIYQFQSFCAYRSKPRTKSDDELAMLADAGQVWSSYSVLNVLYSLIQKSRINEMILAVSEGKEADEIAEIVGEYGAKPLYRLLGYFSLIGLLRVHTLLGDFTLALKVLENVELKKIFNQGGSSAATNSKGTSTTNAYSSFSVTTRVTACHVATYYYVGFCYVMLGRYHDAERTFVTILNFVGRMRQYHTRSYQYDQINKTADRMYALFAICNVLSPSRLDDIIANLVKERYSEQLAKMAIRASQNPSSPDAPDAFETEAIPAFEELFLYACPKFMAANPPPYDDPAALSLLLQSSEDEKEFKSQDPAHRHLSLFLSDVRAQAPISTLRSFLKLYTSLDAEKLAGFLGIGEEELVQGMMAMKSQMRSIVRDVGGKGEGGEGSGGGRGLLEGSVVTTGDLNFVINENMVHIAEQTVGRRFAGWFIRNTEHAQRVYDGLKNSPLPSASKKLAQAPGAEGVPAMATGGAPGGGKTKVAWGGVKVGA